MGFGGPVWHASAAWHRQPTLGALAVLWEAVEDAIRGVGDATLGEWREHGELAVHLRRRVTNQEWGDRPWGMDYRASFEGRKRLDRVLAYMPPSHHAQILSELTPPAPRGEGK